MSKTKAPYRAYVYVSRFSSPVQVGAQFVFCGVVYKIVAINNDTATIELVIA